MFASQAIKNMELTKKIIYELMKVKGEARGITFKTDADFILHKKGGKGLKKVEAELKNLGHPLEYKEIESMNFYPIGLRILSLLAAQKALGFSEKDIEQMGARAPKFSLLIKLFLQFFYSIPKTIKQVPKMWGKHYTVGQLRAEIYEERQHAVVRLSGLIIHPIFCCYLNGYFATVLQMVVKERVTSEEVKCPFKNTEHKYHEFLLKW